MAQMTVVFLLFLLAFGSIPSCQANGFLRAPTNLHSERVSEEDIRVSLLEEVEGSLGKGSVLGKSNRLSKIEDTLRPIVAALPKNAHGNLEHSGVIYALHRLFVARHGWVIKGLNAEAATQNSSSPTGVGVLKDQVPAYIAGMFEQRLAGKGFALRDLAILGATIEHLIHNEAVSRLGAVFNVLKLSVTTPLSKDEVTEVLDTYMMAYVLGEDLNKMNLETARQLTKFMPDVFLAWKDTQKFVDGVRKQIIKDEAADVDFAAVAKVVETAGEEYGTFQDLECREMKEKLVKMEYRGTGRVKLSDFYRPALADGVWSFQESSGYLRSLGALDESDPTQPSVMLVNYIISPSNCIASSGFYSVCCKNECEGLMGHLEERIGSPDASPGVIAALIENLPSQSVSAPRKLSDTLLQRLHDIAATHAGTVPLHSRLFAQWMHHIYPRECPYPHVSGKTDAKLPEEWMEASGSDGTATEEEMKRFVKDTSTAEAAETSTQSDLSVEDIMPWSHEEELIVVRPVGRESSGSESSLASSLRSLALIAASGSLAYGAVLTMQKGAPLGAGSSLGNEKYMV